MSKPRVKRSPRPSIRWKRGAADWLKRLSVRQLRTGLNSADSFRPEADCWFDRVRRAVDSLDLTVNFCFTLEHRGVAPSPTDAEEFAAFCVRMVQRYAPGAAAAIRARVTAPVLQRQLCPEPARAPD